MINEGYQYHRIKLQYLSESHIHRILELAGVRRFLYNFGINYCEQLKDQGKGVPNFNTFCKILTSMRNSEEFGWLKKYNVTTERYAFKDLVNAYSKFFKKINHYPKFKSKKRSTPSCVIREDRFRFKGENGEYAFIPGISKSLNDLIYIGKHPVPINKYADYDNIRIKFDGIDFWLSLSVKIRVPFVYDSPVELPGEGIGVDVGLRTTAALSDGTMFDPPDRRYLDLLRKRRNKIASSCGRDRNKRLKESIRTKTKYENIPKSKNQIKREEKYRKVCIRIRNIVRTHNHQVSRKIADRQPRFVVLETLNIGSLEKNNRYVAPYIHTHSLFQLAEFIEYKCKDIGSTVIRAPRGFKSSQICSNCGAENKVGDSKIYTCSCCGLTIDRDYNAALNLRNYGYYVLSSN